MPPSSVFKQTEKYLRDVLQIIEQDYESPRPVLYETERCRFVEEEQIIKKQLKESAESDSKRFLSWFYDSSQVQRCFKDAQELLQRVEEDIHAKRETRLAGKSNLFLPLSHGQGSTRTPETGAEDPQITSLANMVSSSPGPGISEVDVNPAVRNDYDYTSDIHEAMHSPLEMSSESSYRSCDTSPRPRKRSPPPPPQQMALSSDSLNLSETSSNSGSASRRLSSVRRPPPPPPQSPRRSRAPHSPTITSFPSLGSLPPDPATISSISSFAQHMNTLASSIVTQSLSSQAQGRRRSRCSDYVTKTNCVEITGSSVDGVTLNNGGTKNSGAVIHKTVVPPPPPPRAPPF